MLALIVLFSILGFLGLICPSVSAALAPKWAPQSFGEIDPDCVDIPDACKGNLDTAAKFNACANKLVKGCTLTGYNFEDAMNVACNRSEAGGWGSDFAIKDFDQNQIVGFRLYHRAADLSKACRIPQVSYSTTAKTAGTAEAAACNATENAVPIEGFRFSPTDINIGADLPPITSISVSFLTANRESCPITDISGVIVVNHILQGSQDSSGGDNGNGGASGASLMVQLGTTSLVSVLAMVGLIISHYIF